jgi:membrane protein DedA with SNARE-associated domain
MSAMTFLDANLIQDLIASYGYATVFFVVLLESSSIPLPGETILVCASVYAGAHHDLDIRVIIGPADKRRHEKRGEEVPGAGYAAE